MKTRSFAIMAALGVVAATIFPVQAEPPGAPAAPDIRFGIAEGFRNPGVMADIGPGWERLVFSWNDIQPDRAGDFSRLGLTLSAAQLQAELNRGTRVAGLFQFTPAWAAANPADGQRSVPKNLNLPFDDPNNYFGRYVFETAKHYAGRVNEWIIWNEPEFRETDPGAGGSFTWKGTDEEFAQLMKVGYLAVKKANPNAIVAFPGTSYWVEELSSPKRPQFYDRLLAILARDPSRAANNFYHDTVALNLYRAPDDIYRIYGVFKDIQQKYNVDRPLWLTETNAMPSDDASIPCADRQSNVPIKTTMEQQAAYAVQSLALAAAAGYQRIEFYQMIDSNTCREPAVWGVTRDNGSRRPVADALKTAISNFSGYTNAKFAPLKRERNVYPFSPPVWPDDPTSYVPNWQIYPVAMDKPGNQRVTTLWNGDGSTTTVRIKKNGTSAKVIDRRGNERALEDNQGWWVVNLPGATAYFKLSEAVKDPDGYYFIGGDPLLIVEEGVDQATPVNPPRLGLPGAVAREFLLVLEPPDQTVRAGGPADFVINSFGREDFNDPIDLRISQWSTQRFPDPKPGSTLPLAASFPGAINPGDKVTVHFETAGADGGIYFITIEGSGGGMTKAVDIALVLR